MNHDDREQRLRERIDQLTNERDAAREQLATEKTKNHRLRNSLSRLRQSRELWRDRWLKTGIKGDWRKR